MVVFLDSPLNLIVIEKQLYIYIYVFKIKKSLNRTIMQKTL